MALRAHRAISAKDVSRVDFRLDMEGEPCLMEINTLPGLNPSVSDICIMARAEGLPYNHLILEILDRRGCRPLWLTLGSALLFIEGARHFFTQITFFWRNAFPWAEIWLGVKVPGTCPFYPIA